MTAIHEKERSAWPPFCGRLRDADLARAPSLPEAERRRLARSRWSSVRVQLAQNPSLVPAVQWQLKDDDSEWVVAALAANPSLTGDLLQWVFEQAGGRSLRNLARNPRLQPELQRAFGAGDSISCSTHLAGNPALLPEVMESLASAHNEEVRRQLARNDSVPGRILMRLARDWCYPVQEAAAGNPNLPLPAKRVVALHDVYTVRKALAAAPGLETEIQVVLAEDEHWAVQSSLGGNPALDPGLARSLARRRDSSLLRALAGNEALPYDVHVGIADGGSDAWGFLASIATLDPRLQERLAAAGNARVLLALARNAALREDLQVPVLERGALPVWEALACNPSLGRDALSFLLQRLASVPDLPLPDVMRRRRDLGSAAHWRSASLDHPVLGPMVAALSGKAGIAARAAEHPDPLVRLGLVANPRVDADALACLVADEYAHVRAAAGRRVLEALAGPACR